MNHNTYILFQEILLPEHQARSSEKSPTGSLKLRIAQ